MTITEPGVVYDMSDEAYHRDPVEAGSLSSSGARRLMPPYCPAIFRYEADHPKPPKREFDLGHAAHLELLGKGARLVIVDEKDWRKKDAQQQRDQAYDEGNTPLLTREYEQVKTMARTLRADPVLAALFDPEHGQAEISGFWIDAEFDVWRRFRLDWLNIRPGQRPLVVDFKTTTSIDPRAISKTMHNFGYYMQQPYYLDGVAALDLAEDPAFLFVFQMKVAPWLVQIAYLKAEDVQMGRERNRAALERFRDCQKTGIWPGPSAEPLEIELPRYAQYQWADEQDTTDDN